jgi:peptidoglycan/LPS O-acetylase OafA/YrhL
MGTLVWGLILICLGSVLVGWQWDYIMAEDIGFYFLFGVGCVLLFVAALKQTSLARGSSMPLLIGGLIVMVIGVGGITGFTYSWGLAVIFFGIVIVIYAIRSISKSNPRPP